jgi:hypothetical protein
VLLYFVTCSASFWIIRFRDDSNSMLSPKRFLTGIFNKWPIIGIAIGIVVTLFWATLLIWLPLHLFNVL